MNNQDVIRIGEAIAAGWDKGLQEGQLKLQDLWEFQPEDILKEDWNAAIIRIRQIFAEVDAEYRNK